MDVFIRGYTDSDYLLCIWLQISDSVRSQVRRIIIAFTQCIIVIFLAKCSAQVKGALALSCLGYAYQESFSRHKGPRREVQ
jgi:hypothetical protein